MAGGRAVRLVRLELLLGTVVRDAAGRKVGRIEEVLAEGEGDECRVTAFLIGRGALLERLSIADLRSLLPWAGGRPARNLGRVPWDRLDLADPGRPLLLGDLADLEPVEDPKAAAGDEERKPAGKRRQGRVT